MNTLPIVKVNILDGIKWLNKSLFTLFILVKSFNYIQTNIFLTQKKTHSMLNIEPRMGEHI